MEIGSLLGGKCQYSQTTQLTSVLYDLFFTSVDKKMIYKLLNLKCVFFLKNDSFKLIFI